jgi:hypothetical protein
MKFKLTLALALAALAAISVAALAFAGPYQELQKGKDLWYLIIAKGDKNIGYMHETYEGTTVDGKPAIKAVRTTFDSLSNKMQVVEWVGDAGNPLVHCSVTKNGMKTIGKPAGNFWEFDREGKKHTIERGHFDFFAYDVMGIYSAAVAQPVGASKKLRLYDVVDLDRIERTYKYNGEKETMFNGQKVMAPELEISGGPNVVKVHVAKDIMGILDSRVEGIGISTKLVHKALVIAAFPNAQ